MDETTTIGAEVVIPGLETVDTVPVSASAGKYDWAKLLNGQLWKIGTEYHRGVSTTGFRSAAQSAISGRGYLQGEYTLNRRGEYVYIQALTEPTGK